MSTPASAAEYRLLARPGLRKDFRDKYQEHATQFTQFLNVGTTDVPEVAASLFTGPSRFYEKGDLESVRYEKMKLGPKVAAIDKEFGLGIAVGRKIWEDDMYGKIREVPKHIAHAARMTDEYRSAQFLDDAFAGNTFKGYDGLAWCTASHTFINKPGSLWSNYAGTVSFSLAGVVAIQDLFLTLKDHNGDPISYMPNMFVIGANTGDWHRALQIFGTDKEPFTAENQDNAVKKTLGGNTKIVLSQFKASLKSYFGVNTTLNDAHFLRKRPVQLEDDDDFHTGSLLFKGTTRFLIWGVDPRGWAGANPA